MADINFKAGDFKQNENQKRQIAQIVRGIILDIKQSLKGQPVNDKKISYDYMLPIHFHVDNMDYDMAKRKIYARLIKWLLDNDFNPLIDTKDPDKPFIQVTIYSKEEIQERDYEDQLIEKFTRKTRIT